MGFWQEIVLLVASLGWWQITLVLVATILTGILTGISVSYLIIRFAFKYRVTFFDIFHLLFSKKPKMFTSSNLARHIINTPSSPSEVPEPAKFPIHELLVEIEHNLKIITEFSGDNLLSLQSDVWDARRYSAHTLPVNLREQLMQVYSDIYVLNQIVWFSTEFEYRSSLLNELYSEWLPTITKKLQRVKQDIENNALIEPEARTEIIRDDATIQSLRDLSRQSDVIEETPNLTNSRLDSE
jgi:hypothetical protein